jgi:hypothetical protein
MKPFNIERAKAGEPVVTDAGDSVRIICTDKIGNFPIVALIRVNEELETVVMCSKSGEVILSNSAKQLYMSPVKKEAWVNIYHGGTHTNCELLVNAHSTKEEADSAAASGRVACIKIHWEE